MWEQVKGILPEGRQFVAPEEEEVCESSAAAAPPGLPSLPRPDSPWLLNMAYQECIGYDAYYSQILPISPHHHHQLPSSPLWNFPAYHYMEIPHSIDNRAIRSPVERPTLDIRVSLTKGVRWSGRGSSNLNQGQGFDPCLGYGAALNPLASCPTLRGAYKSATEISPWLKALGYSGSMTKKDIRVSFAGPPRRGRILVRIFSDIINVCGTTEKASLSKRIGPFERRNVGTSVHDQSQATTSMGKKQNKRKRTLIEYGRSMKSLNLEDLQQHSHKSPEEVARSLDVGKSTLKPCRTDKGISYWSELKDISLSDVIVEAGSFSHLSLTTSPSPGDVGCSFASTSLNGCNGSSIQATTDVFIDSEKAKKARLSERTGPYENEQASLSERIGPYEDEQSYSLLQLMQTNERNGAETMMLDSLEQHCIVETHVETEGRNVGTSVHESLAATGMGKKQNKRKIALIECGRSKKSFKLEDLQQHSHKSPEEVASSLDVGKSTLEPCRKDKGIISDWSELKYRSLVEKILKAGSFNHLSLTPSPSPAAVGCSFASTSLDGCHSFSVPTYTGEISFITNTELNTDEQPHSSLRLMQTTEPVISAPDQPEAVPDGIEMMLPDLSERHATVQTHVETKGGDVGTSVQSKAATTMAKKQNKRKPSSTKGGRSKKPVDLEDIKQYSHLSLEEAASRLDVSKSTLKRRCRENGISDWSELKDVKLSEKSAEAGAFSQDLESIIVKATYGDNIIKFKLSSSSKKVDLENEVAIVLNIQVGSFRLKYEDEDGDWVIIASDFNWQDCMNTSRSRGKTIVKLLVLQSV